MSKKILVSSTEDYSTKCVEKYGAQIELLFEFIRQYFIANPEKDFVELLLPDTSKEFLSALHILNVSFCIRRVCRSKNLYRFYSDLWPF